MCEKTKLLINVVGPYRYYGENVIRSCIKSSTHYVDITGEPLFIEKMEKEYNEESKNKKIIIVNSCGFDSIPADIGSLFMRNQFDKNCCYSIDIFHKTNGLKIHSTTWDCIILSMNDYKSLSNIRKERRKRLSYHNPKREVKLIKGVTDDNSYSIKFIGSDASVIKRSQEYETLKDNTIISHYIGVYLELGSIIPCILLLLYFFIIYIISIIPFGKKLLINYPNIFTLNMVTKEGPKKEELEKGKLDTTIIGKGYSKSELENKLIDRKIVVKLTGPNAGYITTSICVVQSAITILSGECKEYGVLTTSSAFKNTNFINEIQKQGIKFTIQSDLIY